MGIIHNDSLIALKDLGENSVDSIVTDPPYGLSFMNKHWDYDVPTIEFWKEALRVLKPGGHLLSFAGSRTYHRMAVNIEDAGFEIRDQIMWVYGSGFPKSHNIGKAVDKKLGNEREFLGIDKSKVRKDKDNNNAYAKHVGQRGEITKGTSEWEGWGTALKPAHEPIVVARKPLSEKTIADNVLKWGCGGINIDGSRVQTSDKPKGSGNDLGYHGGGSGTGGNVTPPQGRFPANFIHDGSDEVVGLFPETKSQGKRVNKEYKNPNNPVVDFGGGIKNDFNDSGSASRFFYVAKSSKRERLLNGFDCATIEVCETIKKENTVQVQSLVRAILDLAAPSLSIGGYGGNKTEAYPKDFISTIRTTIKKITELKTWNSLMLSPTSDFIQGVFSRKTGGTSHVESAEKSKELMMKIGIFQEKVGLATEDVKNATLESLLKLKELDAWQNAHSHHPTHKPVALMQYLVRLVTPKNGTVLDPFMGSGTTGIACKEEGFDFIGIEREEEYIKIAEARICKRNHTAG